MPNAMCWATAKGRRSVEAIYSKVWESPVSQNRLRGVPASAKAGRRPMIGNADQNRQIGSLNVSRRHYYKDYGRHGK